MNVIACKNDEFAKLFNVIRQDCDAIIINSKEELTLEFLERINATVIFFVHWSWIVPDELLTKFECICFHSAPVPYGRGGSPIQNMIVAGHDSTEIVALRMQRILDAGPVYMRVPCSLLGGGEEILIRIYTKIIAMIGMMWYHRPNPEEQIGDATLFKRRKPADSEVPKDINIGRLFDHIRMLDIDGYPLAYIDHGNLRIEFSRPALRFGARIEVTANISYKEF